jgi:hypothetical protein
MHILSVLIKLFQKPFHITSLRDFWGFTKYVWILSTSISIDDHSNLYPAIHSLISIHLEAFIFSLGLNYVG